MIVQLNNNLRLNNKTMVPLNSYFLNKHLSLTLNKHLPVEQDNSIACSRHTMCLGHVFLLVFECVLAFSIMSYEINVIYDLKVF